MNKNNHSKKGIHLLVPVWGEDYLDDYLSLSLPSQLAQNNLLKLSSNSFYVIHYHIVTDNLGKSSIIQHPCFNRLSLVANIHFHDIEILAKKIIDDRNLWRRYSDKDWHKYALKMACMKIGIEQAHAARGIFIPLMSDLIMSDGALSYLLQQYQLGKKCILVGSIKVNKREFKNNCSIFVNEQNNCLAISGEALVKLSVQHLHSWTKNNAVDSPYFNNAWPDYVYWYLPNKAIIQNGNFCYPILIDCLKMITIPTNYTIDTMPLPFEKSELYVITQVEQCMVMVVEDNLSSTAERAGKFDATKVAIFRQYELQPHHYFFSQHAILFGDNKDEEVVQFLNDVKEQIEEISASEKLLKSSTSTSTYHWLEMTTERLGSHWLKNIPNRINRMIEPFDCIIAFGGGTELAAIRHYTHLNSKLVAIIDNDKNKHGKTSEGICVISPTSCFSNEKSKKTAVLICSQQHQLSMNKQLDSLLTFNSKVLNPYENV